MMYVFQKKNSNQRGFTIVEIIIVLGILAGIVGLSASFQAGVFRMNRMFGSSVNISFEANRAVKDMSRIIRSLAPSEQGAYPVEMAATSTFIFFSDIDRDGVVERVRYYLATSTLMMGVVEPSGSPLTYTLANEKKSQLIHHVRNDAGTPLFTYYDRNYTGTTTPLTQPVARQHVRHVRVHVLVDVDPLQLPGPVSIISGMTFRNLKDNQ